MKKLLMYCSFVKSKVYQIFNKNIAFTARVINSSIDNKSVVRSNCRIYGSTIDKYTYITRNGLIQNSDIGAFCSISENVNIGLPSHPIDMVSTSPVFISGCNYLKKNFSNHKFCNDARTVIGNDVWIGADVMIKSGLTIGNGAVIGAGAVVTHNIPPYAVVGGIPAKIIKYRFDDDVINKLLVTKWWNNEDKKIEEISKNFNSIKNFINTVNGDE